MIETTRTHRADAGFTLLELLVVMGVLALVAAVAVPSFVRPSDRARLEGASREILSAFLRARAVAIARATDMAVVVDVDKRTVESPVAPTVRVDREIEIQLTVAEPERTTSFRGAVRFYPDGSSTGGNVRLALHGKDMHLCVDWLTGRARDAKQC